MRFREYIRDHVLVIDGAMGTQVQNLDLHDEDFGGEDFKMLTDLLTFAHPDALKQIHLDYYNAGAQAVETNTFGASPFRLVEFDFSKIELGAFEGLPEEIDIRTASLPDLSFHLARRAAEVACEARAEAKESGGAPRYVIGSVGPSNRVLSSTEADLAVSTFDEMADNFYHQCRGLIAGGADIILFETQQDIVETKAGVFGARRAIGESGKDIGLMAQVTVDAFARMQIFNTDIHAAQVTVSGIGVDTFGINCSIGPDLMQKTVENLSAYCPIPISVIPNAGLPVSEGGRTVFKFKPDDMAQYLKSFVEEYGVSVVGGCCGTTPEHISAIAEAVRDSKPADRKVDRSKVWVSGPQQAIALDSSDALLRFGERLNVRGSKKVREAVESGGGIDHDALEEVVHEQVHELGLTVIDVCMDSNEVDTTTTLKEVIFRQTTDFPGAMCIDSFALETLVEAIKVYPGRPIINSISMEEVEDGVTKAEAVIRATNGHNPVYVGLAAGPKGPGATREEKADLARQIVEVAGKHGVGPQRLFIDMNVFPIGSESDESLNFAVESLEAIPLIKAIHPEIKTICGVGNLTNGLAKKPYMRTVLTSVWLDEGRKKGLDAAIVNPNHYIVVDDLDDNDRALAHKIIFDRDMDAFADLEEIAEKKSGSTKQRRTTYDDLSVEDAICEKIKDGYKQREHGDVEVEGHHYKYADKIVLQVAEVIKDHDPLTFINDYLMRAMNELGDGFARGEVSLPHLLKSADVMKQVMGFLESYMKISTGADLHEGVDYKGTIVLGTVFQDVHSIGKDLAKTLFENYGYRVIDLGVMTPLQQYLDTAKEYNADAIGMSALLVQTSNHMITVAKMMEEQDMTDTPILIGGAPVNNRHAAFVAMGGGEDPDKMRDDVFYCATAMDGVNLMNNLLGEGGPAELLGKNKEKLQKSLEKAADKQKRDAELLEALPRREISFAEYSLPASPWLPYECVRYKLTDFKDHVDRRTLYSLNWKFGGSHARNKQGDTSEKLDALFAQWVEHASFNDWIQPMGIMGVFPCQSDGEEVVVYDPEDTSEELARFRFDVVIGARKKDTISCAQYFRPKDSSEFDAVGLQLSTSGPHVDPHINRFREDGDSESCLYLQGLSDRIAEDMADHLHDKLRKHMGFENGQGARWSPGYPAITDTGYNKTILKLLHAEDLLGVKITEAGEFSPTGTTAAIVSFHPDARYT